MYTNLLSRLESSLPHRQNISDSYSRHCLATSLSEKVMSWLRPYVPLDDRRITCDESGHVVPESKWPGSGTAWFCLK